MLVSIKSWSLNKPAQLFFCVAISLLLFSFSQNANSNDYIDDVSQAKIHEIAKQIRQQKKWQILSITTEDKIKQPEKNRQLFRFKLLGKNGNVKIVSIDLDDFDIHQQFK